MAKRPSLFVFGVVASVCVLMAGCSKPPIWKAASDGNTPEVERMLADGVDANSVAYNGRSVLAVAVIRRNSAMVKSLMDKGADPYLQDKQGQNPVILAAGTGNAEILGMLLQKRGDINLPTRRGNTALHNAAESGNVDCVKMLLAAGAKKDVADAKGRRPVDWAGGNATAPLLRVN